MRERRGLYIRHKERGWGGGGGIYLDSQEKKDLRVGADATSLGMLFQLTMKLGKQNFL